MLDSLNVQNEIGARSIDQPVEGGQNSQVSFRKNDYEHTPYADEVNLKGNENNNSNTGKIVGLGVAALAISSAIYAGLHGKNILTKAEKETGFMKNIKEGYKNFFRNSEKAAERIKTTEIQKTVTQAEETIEKKAKTWDEVIKDSRFDDDAVKMLNENLNDAEKSRVISRDLLSFKTGDDRLLDKNSISFLARISDEEFANIEKRGLLNLKNAESEAFSGISIGWLARLDDVEFANIEKRGLLKLENANRKAFDGCSIAMLAHLDDAVFANIEKRGLLKLKTVDERALSGYSISILAKAEENEFAALKERIINQV